MAVTPISRFKQASPQKLLKGDVLVSTRPHTSHGGAVTATAYLPLSRAEVWRQLTTYSRWTEFFPDICHSEVVEELSTTRKRLFQAARKTFLMLNVEVEIQLCAHEMTERAIVFEMESPSGSFEDFSAELQLQDLNQGTQISYSVQATSKIPIPSLFVEQAMKLDLPMNMRHLREALLSRAAVAA